jgi:hypothetical protein
MQSFEVLKQVVHIVTALFESLHDYRTYRYAILSLRYLLRNYSKY